MGLEEAELLDDDDSVTAKSVKSSNVSCSICLELVVFNNGRSCVKLVCGHEFHLDCIGSAFNSRGSMQCPNCRNVEKGQWLYGSGGPVCDDPHDEEFYDLSYSEMMDNRHWMYIPHIPNGGGWNEEFLDGVEEFIRFAKSQEDLMDEDKIKCPCVKCKNGKFQEVETVRVHLYKKGFIDNYYSWTAHGEPPLIQVHVGEGSSSSHHHDMNFFGVGMDIFDNLNPCERMIFDAAVPNFVAPQWLDTSTAAGNETRTTNEEEHATTISPNHDESSSLSKRFYEVLKAANDPVYPGCAVTLLSAVTNFMAFKTDYHLSQSGYNRLLDDVGELLPPNHNLPKNFYESKRMIRSLGLPVQKIHLCSEGCMLFWKGDANHTECKFCRSPRYEERLKKNGKPIPRRVLRYLPLIPRLQRLYAMEETAQHMRWHADYRSDQEGVMTHPSHGEAWRHLDRTFPHFAAEVRNVRLGLCSDGFSPFGMNGKTYSTWPVILTPYNLPPNMCMQPPYLLLNTIVPGPKNPKRLIDICLQPLIDELQVLWDEGVLTYDCYAKENFIMRAALLWTVNDFPAYGMLSGWSTGGINSCPCCMENTKAFRLQHGRKASWFGCHRRMLAMNHPFRKDKKNFYYGRNDHDTPPPYLYGHDLWERVQHLPTAIESPLEKPEGYGSTHKFTKQSIFWSLPYWKFLLLRHNLDVMHIEKNVFENVFNTVLDVKGKTKDNLSSRKDLKLYCKRTELEVEEDHHGPKPKAVYTLSKEKKVVLLNWLKCLRFPDGYVSNIGRCVNLDECKMVGMKSHDCHVFMQRLLPIAFKELLPVGVWGPLTELSLFFQYICSSMIDEKRLRELENEAPVILCKLERIFPPSFFDCMEHLIVHLPHQARLAGPVKYWWMYPFERFLYTLKQKLSNSKCVEASIVEAYLLEETTNFSKHYPSHGDLCKRRRLSRNEMEGLHIIYPQISIFNYPGRPSGKAKVLWMNDERDLQVLHTYILLNCPEMDSYLERFQQSENGYGNNDITTHFLPWLKSDVLNQTRFDISPLIQSLAWGPARKVLSWPSYYINGYKFETREHCRGKLSMNSGVCVQASCGESQSDFFGMIDQILEFEFTGLPCKKIVLFKCLWYDPTSKTGTNVHPQYHLQEINVKKRYKNYEPFVLAQQCTQVYYADYPGASRTRTDWRAVCKTRPRCRIDERWTEKEANHEPLQQDDIEMDRNLFTGVSVDELPRNLLDPNEVDDERECESDSNEDRNEHENEEDDFPSETETKYENDNVSEDDNGDGLSQG